MSYTAVILAVLVCGLVSRANSTTCLSCREVVRPRDCSSVQECGRHEKCSIESYVTVSGDIRYNVGCMDIIQCVAAGRKRDILNATVLNEIQQKNVFGVVHEEQSDPKDVIVCSECCDEEICNIKGCGEQGLPLDSGLLCYACEQEVTPDKCNKISLCSRDSSCHLSTLHVGVDIIYRSDCIPTHVCQHLGVLDIGAYQLVGRRGVDMINRFQRGAMCNKCCSKHLCNSDNCTSVITASITAGTTTQATTTLAPVNGGWSTWSHWNMCSLTCGGGQQYRVRVCNNPPPANAGASCSGSNKETQICSNQPCTVDGNWSDWGLWSACSATCGSSVTRSRARTCTNPAPTSGGANCIGMASDVETCNTGACQVDGNWSNWGLWSACTATCGSSVTRSRSRDCTNPAPTSGGANCVGTGSDIETCKICACSGPHVIRSAQNFTRSLGSQIQIHCLVQDSLLPQEEPNVTWTIPQIVGHPLPKNLEQFRDGSLAIHGLTVENCGPYFCTLTTDCGSYDSSDFYVSTYESK